MKDIIAEKNGYKVIRVNCAYSGRQSRKEACIKGVLESELNSIFDLSSIKWDDINKKASDNSILQEICSLYNNGLSSFEIAEKLKKDNSSVIDYLKNASSLGLCQYAPYKHRSKGRRHVTPVLCIDYDFAFDSFQTLANVSEPKFLFIKSDSDISSSYPHIRHL